MHNLIRNVSLVLLLAHMFAGCCWHHAHAALYGCGSSRAEACPWDEGVYRPGRHVADDRGHHEHGTACDKSHCVFVVPDVRGRQPLGVWAKVAPPHAAPYLAALRVRSLPVRGSPLYRLPPRLHLLHEVLLL